MNQDQLTVRTETAPGGIGVVAVGGYINNEGGQRVADAALGLFERGARTLLLDLEGTRIVNSVGVSILLEVLERVLDGGGRLAFCNLSPTIAKTFDIMGLTQYATIHPDRERALAELAGDAGA